MSQEEINKSLQKTLLSPLTHDLFWSQFLHATSYELANMREKYATIKDNWNIYKNDLENLVRISESFGYTPNLIINNTIKDAQIEIESIPYRIRKKTTTDGYYLILKQINALGEIFNYYYDGHKLIKMIDWEETVKNIVASNHYSPFYGIVPDKNINFLAQTNNIILDYLKNGEKQYDDNDKRIYYLDQEIEENNERVHWILDYGSKQTPSKHLSLEYYPKNYYVSYSVSLGLMEENKHIYETYIPTLNYVEQSITLEVGKEFININITKVGDEENIEEIREHEEDPLKLNQSTHDLKTGLVHLDFNSIEEGCEIIVHYNINLLMDSNYFYYFENEMNYNRRSVVIPHSGIFLFADIASSQGSDYYHNNDGDYSIEDLKLKGITTVIYDREKNNLNDEDVIRKFKYICSGNNALNVPNQSNHSLFSLNNVVFSYNMNSAENGVLKDNSSNAVNCQIIGNANPIKGIISKSLNFNGNTYAESTKTIAINSSNSYSLGIWFNPSNSPTDGEKTIYDGFVKVTYDGSSVNVYNSSTHEGYLCQKNENNFVVFTFSSGKINIYLNGSHVLTDVSFSISTNTYRNHIGTDSLHNSNFIGLIDSIWLMNKVITSEEVNYIYQNKISIISNMGNMLNRYRIYDKEKYLDESGYRLIQSYVQAMDINNENFIIENNDDSEINIQTNVYPINPSYFSITNRNLTLKTNDRGELYDSDSGEIIDGQIDFENGKISLLKNSLKTISQQVIEKVKADKMASIYLQKQYTDDEGVWMNSDGQELSPVPDYVNIESASDKKTILICHETNDSSQRNIYTDDDKNTFYLKKTQDKLDDLIQAFIINNEVHTFSTDNGRHLYLTLNDVGNDLNSLHSYIEVGEPSQTRIYSNNLEIENNQTQPNILYLDVKCTKEVNKVTYNTNKVGYIYNRNFNSVYTDLTFTELIPDVTVTINDIISSDNLNLIEMGINYTPTEMEVNEIESEEWYYSVWKYNYIKTIENKDITIFEDNKYRNITNPIINTIKINYWIKENNIPKKYIATINDNGSVSGINIESGFYDTETHKLSITFNEKIENDVTISYNYEYRLKINYEAPLVLKYKAKNKMIINEIGLENENHELLAYMTFNDVEFNDIYNHASAMFAIKDLD